MSTSTLDDRSRNHLKEDDQKHRRKKSSSRNGHHGEGRQVGPFWFGLCAFTLFVNIHFRNIWAVNVKSLKIELFNSSPLAMDVSNPRVNITKSQPTSRSRQNSRPAQDLDLDTWRLWFLCLCVFTMLCSFVSAEQLDF
jgi:hypothetical protein